MLLENPLSSYTPDTETDAPVEFDESLHHVIDNIAQVLPKETIWNLFTSAPSETGGKISFPYYRVDVGLILIKDNVQGIERLGLDGNKNANLYTRATKHAFKTLVWVEIGFNGLQQFAYNDSATKNWTSGPGHSATTSQRAAYILGDGKTFYNECLSKFANFRRKNGIKDDLFATHNLEGLLKPFISN